MSERYQTVHLAHAPGAKLSDVSAFSRTEAEAARAFHRSIPGYVPTPLADLPCLARELGVARVLVKDESFRFGLNAFKVLGGSWAIARALAARLGLDPKEMTYERLTSDETRTRIGKQTFVTATDGNHGRGVAWTAAKLKQRCIVYMPKGSSRERLENIRALGAEASITDVNYDGAVEMARETAERLGGTLVQDTSWPGYEDVPRWIMQGYTTLALEACEQLNGEIPTHVFLQAGVGSMAGAVAGFFASLWGDERRPAVTVVEPEAADCVFRTASAHDGTIHSVGGDLSTIMAGLACGVPCSLGWVVLRDHADHFVSMPDEAAAQGMRILGAPCGTDPRVISGESGAAGFGLFAQAMRDPSLAWLKEALGLNERSRVLCISTEGDTDRANYRRIVWDGAWSSARE